MSFLYLVFHIITTLFLVNFAPKVKGVDLNQEYLQLNESSKRTAEEHKSLYTNKSDPLKKEKLAYNKNQGESLYYNLTLTKELEEPSKGGAVNESSGGHLSPVSQPKEVQQNGTAAGAVAVAQGAKTTDEEKTRAHAIEDAERTMKAAKPDDSSMKTGNLGNATLLGNSTFKPLVLATTQKPGNSTGKPLIAPTTNKPVNVTGNPHQMTVKPEMTSSKPNLGGTGKPTALAKPEDSAKSGAAKSEVAKPEEAKSEAAKSEAVKPEETKPEPVKPEAAKPEETKPDVTNPEAAKPEDSA